jgi:hypothetical protein
LIPVTWHSANLFSEFNSSVERTEFPEYLEPSEVQSLFVQIDCQTLLGRRDDALLRLLNIMGMRAQEVVDLDVNHLRFTLNNDIKSPDFLNVKQFRLITFKSRSVQKVNDQQYTLTGDLTFHGVTKPLTLRANLIGQSKDSKGELHTGADIYLVIKRSEFGVTHDSPAVGDDILLTIRVRN